MNIYSVFCVLTSLFVFLSVDASGNEDRVLSESALAAHLRSSNPDIREERLAAARATMAENGRKYPNRDYAATAVIRDGANTEQLVKMVNDNSLEILRLEFKVPTDGNVTTISMGASDLLMMDGTLENRVSKVVDLARDKMLEYAPLLAKSGDDVDYSVAFQEMRVYKIEVIGSAVSLAAMSVSNEFSGVFLDDDRIVESHRRMKAKLRGESQK